jgi:hypothetical protein
VAQQDQGASSPSAPTALAPPSGVKPASGLEQSRSSTGAKVERLALNLRAYAYAMGAPRKDIDEEVALDAARLILRILEAMS